jgi:hypothetical protein
MRKIILILLTMTAVIGAKAQKLHTKNVLGLSLAIEQLYAGPIH